MSTTFYTSMVNRPGYLPDGDSPPPVFKNYGEASEYLADTLDVFAMNYEDNDRTGDRFESMAEACRESSEDDRFAMDGPDGYHYAVEETVSRGQWIAGPEQIDDFGDRPASYVVLTFTERADGLGPTAREAADDIASIDGCNIEQSRGDNFAYAMIDSGRLSEAAEELRDSGFELLDSEGELVA